MYVRLDEYSKEQLYIRRGISPCCVHCFLLKSSLNMLMCESEFLECNRILSESACFVRESSWNLRKGGAKNKQNIFFMGGGVRKVQSRCGGGKFFFGGGD